MATGRSSRSKAVVERNYTLSEQTARLLREAILSGRLPQGERLVEARIADQLGVSRGPVREAIRTLRSEGLVSVQPHMGASVIRLTTDEIGHVYEIRCAIEAQAARKVAARGNPADLAELRHAFTRLVAAAERGDRAGFARLDLAFHETVCRLSANPRLLAIFQSLTALVRPLQREEHERFYPNLADLAREHEQLLDALASADVELARRAFEEHVDQAQRHVVTYLHALAGNDGQ